MTDANPADGSRELRAVNNGGSQTGVVFELANGLSEDTRQLAVGPDELRLLALPSENDLAVGGGVLQRRTVQAYDPDTREVTVAEPFDPEPEPNTPWRMKAELGLAASSLTGRPNVFVWDSSDALEGNIALRIVPLDTDVGLGVEGLAEKRVRSFQDPFPVGSPEVHPNPLDQSVTAADLNDDGLLDLAYATGGSFANARKLAIFYQRAPVDLDPPLAGRGIFPSTPDVSVGNNTSRATQRVVAADLNGDGRLDLASSNESSDNLTIFFQELEGGFENDAPPDVALGLGLNHPDLNHPIGLEVADLDRDGLLDLAMSNTESATVTVFFQTSPGEFDPVPTVLEDDPTAPNFMFTEQRAPNVEVADLDGDGWLDLAFTHYNAPFPGGDSYLRVFLQTGPRQFLGTPDRLSTDVPTTNVLAADMDGDGRIDLASANRPSNGMGGTGTGDNNITVYHQQRNAPGRFPEQPALVLRDAGSIDFPYNMVAADLNVDAGST